MNIALIGNNQASRTIVARYLEKAYHYKYTQLQDGVERIYRLLYFGEKYSRVPWEKRIRIYDALYDLDPTTWVHYLDKRLATTERKMVVPDARYVSEIEHLRAKGFIIIRVVRPYPTAPHIGKALLDAKEGTIILREYYDRGSVKVDYAMDFDTREGARKSVDYIVNKLTERHG